MNWDEPDDPWGDMGAGWWWYRRAEIASSLHRMQHAAHRATEGMQALRAAADGVTRASGAGDD